MRLFWGGREFLGGWRAAARLHSSPFSLKARGQPRWSTGFGCSPCQRLQRRTACMRQTESSHLASCPPQPPRLLLGVAEHSTKRAFSEACRRSLLAKGGPARLWQGGEQRSFATISASDVRQGTFLLLDGNPVEVTGFHLLKSGRGAASVSLTFIDLNSFKTNEQNFSVSKKLEKIEPVKRTLSVLYVEDGDVLLCDEEFEQISVPLKLFGGPSVAEFLTPETKVGVYFNGETPFKVSLPTSVLTLLRQKK